MNLEHLKKRVTAAIQAAKFKALPATEKEHRTKRAIKTIKREFKKL